VAARPHVFAVAADINDLVAVDEYLKSTHRLA
jgi:hypothetical protein